MFCYRVVLLLPLSIYRSSNWSSQGLAFVGHNGSYVECSSEHLTPFSVLVDAQEERSTTVYEFVIVPYDIQCIDSHRSLKHCLTCPSLAVSFP